MKTPLLKSRNLQLRPPSRDDYDVLRNVRPCKEFYLMVGESTEGNPKYKSDQAFEASFVETLQRENYWNVFNEGDAIGVVFLHSLDPTDKRARYAVGIYQEENWNSGYGQEIASTVLSYAFSVPGLHKVDLRVLEYNKRAIASYENSGFVVDGVLRENAYINDAWHDDLLMSILAREF